MKIAVTSDLHGQVLSKADLDTVKGCSALLLAGDIFENVNGYVLDSSLDALGKMFVALRDAGVPVIMTPGNHDFNIYAGWLKEHPQKAKNLNRKILPRLRMFDSRFPITKDFLKEFLGIELLIDETFDLDGVKIYGTPWSPEFCRWAFMQNDKDLEPIFKKIPKNADIVISHGPPAIPESEIDIVKGEYDHLGSVALYEAIKSKPAIKYLFCGHIHTGDHGESRIGETKCYNVSYIDERYARAFSVKVIEI